MVGVFRCHGSIIRQGRHLVTVPEVAYIRLPVERSTSLFYVYRIGGSFHE